jgi:hypothetical protein
LPFGFWNSKGKFVTPVLFFGVAGMDGLEVFGVVSLNSSEVLGVEG